MDRVLGVIIIVFFLYIPWFSFLVYTPLAGHKWEFEIGLFFTVISAAMIYLRGMHELIKIVLPFFIGAIFTAYFSIFGATRLRNGITEVFPPTSALDHIIPYACNSTFSVGIGLTALINASYYLSHKIAQRSQRHEYRSEKFTNQGQQQQTEWERQQRDRAQQEQAEYETRKHDSVRREAIEFLDLKEPFTQAELKKRRSDLLKKNHPDLGGSTKITKIINSSYEALAKEFK